MAFAFLKKKKKTYNKSSIIQSPITTLNTQNHPKPKAHTMFNTWKFKWSYISMIYRGSFYTYITSTPFSPSHYVVLQIRNQSSSIVILQQAFAYEMYGGPMTCALSESRTRDICARRTLISPPAILCVCLGRTLFRLNSIIFSYKQLMLECNFTYLVIAFGNEPTSQY